MSTPTEQTDQQHGASTRPRRQKLWSLARDIGFTLRLVWQASPYWNVINLLLVALLGVLPLVSLFLVRNIIDAATAGIVDGNMHQAIRRLLFWVAFIALVSLSVVACNSFAYIANITQSQLVLQKFSSLIQTQSISVDLDFYENAQAHNLMSRAQQDATSRPQEIFSTIISLIQNSITVLGIFGILLAFNWKLTLFISLIAIPGAYIGMYFGRKIHALLMQQAEDERRCRYYNLVIIDPFPAKEIRLYQLGAYFCEQYRRLQQSIHNAKLNIFRTRARYDFMANAMASVSISLALGYIGVSALEKTITVGAMVMYYQAFQSASSNLQSFLRNLTGLYEQSLFLEHIYQFLQVKPAIAALHPVSPVPDISREGVRFRGVSFSYPGAAHPTLSDIDLELEPGQVIALVGENGSGKTTLIKLLCRLYDPTAGQITLDNTDIRHFEPEEWRHHLSVVFQDFMRYYASAYENISTGDIHNSENDAAVLAAAQAAGIDEKIKSLPHGYQTELGKAFTGGEELSGGEWQKIALARAFMRHAPIIVLDEPSSALDPLAEADLFTNFRELIKGKSAILISHRFSTVQMADYIYVLEGGRIIERGSHQHLLNLNGSYAHLYYTQASQYLV